MGLIAVGSAVRTNWQHVSSFTNTCVIHHILQFISHCYVMLLCYWKVLPPLLSDRGQKAACCFLGNVPSLRCQKLMVRGRSNHLPLQWILQYLRWTQCLCIGVINYSEMICTHYIYSVPSRTFLMCSSDHSAFYVELSHSFSTFQLCLPTC